MATPETSAIVFSLPEVVRANERLSEAGEVPLRNGSRRKGCLSVQG
jgi:hypothetical protein